MRGGLWLVGGLAASALLAYPGSPPPPPARVPPPCGQAVPRRQMVEARRQAGLVELQGPGVVVTLDDSPRSRPTDADPYFYLVHDVDLQALVNELWASGAEAIAINDQRVVHRTSIDSRGPAIRVNRVRLSPPYQIRAIGPESLAGALGIPGGFLDSVNMLVKCGGQARVEQVAEVRIPAYAGSLDYRYARPIK